MAVRGKGDGGEPKPAFTFEDWVTLWQDQGPAQDGALTLDEIAERRHISSYAAKKLRDTWGEQGIIEGCRSMRPCWGTMANILAYRLTAKGKAELTAIWEKHAGTTG